MELKEYANLFKDLGDETRLLIIKELQRSILLFRASRPPVSRPWALSLSDSGFAKTVAKVRNN